MQKAELIKTKRISLADRACSMGAPAVAVSAAVLGWPMLSGVKGAGSLFLVLLSTFTLFIALLELKDQEKPN